MTSQNRKSIFVAGSTGKQGTAVTKSLLNKGFNVKALVRNPASARAQLLRKWGAEIITGDLNEPGSFSEHVKTAYGVFCVLTFKDGTNVEMKQGFALADLAKEHRVNHFLYSSVIAADLNTGIPHWASKFQIENYIKEIGLPFTIIRPSSLYENFLIPPLKKRILKGKFPSPVHKDVVQQYISATDIGEISAAIFMNREKYLGKTFAIAAEQLSIEEVVNTFSVSLGKNIKIQKIPRFLVLLLLGKTIAKMMKWVNENDGVFVKDIDAFRKEFPGLVSLSEWIKIHFQ
jgi:uncharacterized protein YbjT (DUF2867 family)